MSEYHTPVLLQESVSALVQNPHGIYADATFGGGGHTAGILSRLSEDGTVIAFDRDMDAIDNPSPVRQDPRLHLVHNNFRFIHNYCILYAREKGMGEEECETGAILSGVLADLGVSSHQFDTPERGFSFRFDAPLDMRMNKEGGKSAADIVNTYSEKDLERIMRLYGEVSSSRQVARLLVSEREKSPILTTQDLDKAIEPVTPKAAAHKFLPKVYQALRIEVNQEMRSLEKFLTGATKSLREGGILAVITYQSLEDRMVKNFIRSGNIDGREEKDMFGKTQRPLEAVTKKPLVPSEEEISGNTRARSAKLRIARKGGGRT